MANKNLEELTKTGKDNLQKELEELINVKKPDILEKLNAAKEMGDLSENADYKFAKDDLAKVEARISELEYILDNSKVVKVKENDKSVTIGKTVTLKRVDNGREIVVSLVSKHEVDASNSSNIKISPVSPIGSSILGHTVGEIVTINAKVPYQVEIISVNVSK